MGVVKKKVVVVTVEFEGLHRWKDCQYEEVNFLREWHRHKFFVKVGVRVDGSDREVEFFTFKYWLEREVLKEWKGKRFESSCEMIAEEIGKRCLDARYRVDFVEVWEDGENGARVEWE